MFSKSHLLLAGLIASGTALAAVLPAKQPVSKYSHLSENSPFTVKPTVKPGPQPESALNDWALGGVSEVEGGYMVTLVNKKNQGETQIIRPRGTVHSTKDEMKWISPGSSGSFKIDRVEFGKKSWKDTIVTISVGDDQGIMKFDDKQLSPAAAAVPVSHPALPKAAAAQPQPTAPSIGHPPRQRASQLSAPTTQSRPSR